MKEINVYATPESCANAVSELNKFVDFIDGKYSPIIVDALAEYAVGRASYNFSVAEYDGDNDVIVTSEKVNEHSCDIVASGMATLFIEFGTGVYNADDHPERGVDGIVGHGEYGDGSGGSPWGWSYYGNPGTNGTIVHKNSPGSHKVHTYGNIANMSLYNAKLDTEDEASAIVRRVVGNA